LTQGNCGWAIAKPQRAANGSKGKGEFNDDAPS
jgi:hypothetical protein